MTNRIIGYHTSILSDTTVALETSSGNVCVTDQKDALVKFLVSSAPYVDKTTPRATWSLTDLLDAIKTVLPADMVEKLENDPHRCEWYDNNNKRYKFYLQPGKFLCASYGYDNEYYFYQLKEIYPYEPEHQNAAQVQTLCDALSDEFGSLGVRNLKSLNSPVAVLEEAGIMSPFYAGLPDQSTIDPGCWELSVLASEQSKAWCSAYQVGYFPETHEYDIASSFPGQAIRLPDLRNATYKRDRKSIPAGAAMGFIKGTLHINPDHPSAWCSPIISDVNANLWGNPVGHVKGVFTLAQVEFVRRYGIGDIEKQTDGWFIFLPPRPNHPFEPMMNHFYAIRKSRNDDLHDEIVKRVMTGVLGNLHSFKFGTFEPRDFCNTVYSSYILSGSSLQVGSFIIDNQIQPGELVSVNTDGLHTTRKLALVNKKAGMGQWRYDGAEPVIALAGDKIIAGDDADHLLGIVGANRKATSFDMDGKIYSLPSLAGTVDRYFPKYPITGAELLAKTYTSEPFVINK